MKKGIQKVTAIQQATVSGEVNGVEMGVLSDGTPYLSMRGLSRLIGVSNAHLSEVSKAWLQGKRDSKLAQFLVQAGVASDSLYQQTSIPGVAGNALYAFPDDICTLVLEYYALEQKNAQALQNYRLISRAGLRLFIYTALGYDPRQLVPQPWRQFHDRMTIVSAPAGYFSVFKESADFVIHSINGGLTVDDHTIPDISIGITWAAHWEKSGYNGQFGTRIRHEHNYPEYFPQAASNPQAIWVYPVAALGAFRIWLQNTYVPQKFPAYLDGKVAKGLIAASAAEMLLTTTQSAAALPPAPPR